MGYLQKVRAEKIVEYDYHLIKERMIIIYEEEREFYKTITKVGRKR